MGEVNPNAARGLDKILQACANALAPYLAPYLEDHYQNNSEDLDYPDIASRVMDEIDGYDLAQTTMNYIDGYDLYEHIESYVQDEIYSFMKNETFTFKGTVHHDPS